MNGLAGRKVTIVGGDGRNDYLGARLAEAGAEVWLVRRRPPRTAALNHSPSLDEALAGAELLVCPMPPFGPGGRIWCEDPQDEYVLDEGAFARMTRPALVFAGSFPPALSAEARRAGCEPISLGELDELAILNSIPTAEGAVLLALQQTTVTLHGAPTLVIGYGRTGQTLAATLRALSAEVTVVARRPEARARALASGCASVGFERLREAADGACFVFNTVPALVLVQDVLSRLHPRAVIVDLASGQGGTDFAAAESLGLRAVLAPALPGRVAPETAGGYLADVIIRTVEDRLGGRRLGRR